MMNRIFHTWEKWECYPAGFYESRPKQDLSNEECEAMYRDFLRDSKRFDAALTRVLAEWPRSCEHYLSNERMNRIAWLGQAAMCIDTGIPSCFRGGFNLLTENEQHVADNVALWALNLWLKTHGEQPLTMEQAQSKTKADLY